MIDLIMMRYYSQTNTTHPLQKNVDIQKQVAIAHLRGARLLVGTKFPLEPEALQLRDALLGHI